MRELENLKELYLEEIRKINKKGELNPTDGESAKRALEALEKINDICDKECKDEMDKGYSEGMSRAYSDGISRGYSDGINARYYGGHSMMPEMMRHDGYSYDYSGYRGQSRDSMGRFSRDDAAEHMIHSLEDMLRTAPSERHREAINDCIRKLRNY